MRKPLARRPPDRAAPRFRSEFVDGSVALIFALGIAAVTYWVINALTSVGSNPATQADRIDVVKTSLTVVGFMAAVFAAVYAYRKQRLTESEAHRADATQYANRYTTAAEQLGHDSAAVRLAGVYAMTRLADDSEEQRQTCIDVLCAYLRMPFDPALPPDETHHRSGEKEVRASIQRVIADHLRPEKVESSSVMSAWSGYQFDFRVAVLVDTEFEGVHFDYPVSFQGTTFFGDAGFGGTTFTGDAGFNGATFSGDASFGGATFTGDAKFDKATFVGNIEFDKVTFSGKASFDSAAFSGLAWFGEAMFSADAWFGEAAFSRLAWFGEATFSGNAWFGEAAFSADAGFEKAEFVGEAGFGEATFSGHAWFREATFTGDAWFRETAFWGEAWFRETIFSGSATVHRMTYKQQPTLSGKPFHDWPEPWGPAVLSSTAILP